MVIEIRLAPDGVQLLLDALEHTLATGHPAVLDDRLRHEEFRLVLVAEYPMLEPG